jgi:class 3 adenylate cyclase
MTRALATGGGDTRYVRAPGGYIGYQVFGRGPRELLFITNWETNVDVMWEEPALARHLNRLGELARVAVFDKRGSGISDPVPLEAPTSLEAWLDDARVVADAARFGRAVILGDTEGGPMAVLFAATYPERTAALILVNTFARLLRSEDYPIGIPPRVATALAERYEETWGTGDVVELTAPGVAGDAAFRQWMGRYERLSMPRRASRIMFDWVQRFDVRAILPNIQAPTLVIQRHANRYYRAVYGQYLAREIPHATYAELPGADAHPFYANSSDVLDEIETFVTGTRPPALSDRRLATVLFTDIVDSTGHAARLGDSRWRELLAAHHALVRRELGRHAGREIDTTGDGFLAIFDGPTRAVLCALAIVDAAPDLGIDVRAAVHTGEIELVGENVAGIAVHIAARVLAAAGPHVVLTTSTVRDLAVGSPIVFEPRGTHELRGVPGEWQLLEATASR